ncbi:hypothetical protein [Nocardioides sp.]|uniref:hypothetical protein n=1 Tax=Nocardioides sp. TaxID=35761 RepID=UPI002B27B570|nr:hypothetical protein [Nocardioides sp.]
MRRTLGTTLLTVILAVLLAGGLLTGCGSETDTEAIDPAASPTPSSTPSSTPTTAPSSTQTDGDAAEPVDYDVVAMPSMTAAGGRTSPMLTPVSTPDELDTFVSQFRLEEFADQVRTEATEAGERGYDGQLWAAIVSVGCDVPPGVFVEEGEAGYLVTPLKVKDPLQECFAAVTTVALVAIR